jgi:hypothetical protein
MSFLSVDFSAARFLAVCYPTEGWLMISMCCPVGWAKCGSSLHAWRLNSCQFWPYREKPTKTVYVFQPSLLSKHVVPRERKKQLVPSTAEKWKPQKSRLIPLAPAAVKIFNLYYYIVEISEKVHKPRPPPPTTTRSGTKTVAHHFFIHFSQKQSRRWSGRICEARRHWTAWFSLQRHIVTDFATVILTIDIGQRFVTAANILFHSMECFLFITFACVTVKKWTLQHSNCSIVCWGGIH